jgi:hypothetical protein
VAFGDEAQRLTQQIHAQRTLDPERDGLVIGRRVLL